MSDVVAARLLEADHHDEAAAEWYVLIDESAVSAGRYGSAAVVLLRTANDVRSIERCFRVAPASYA